MNQRNVGTVISIALRTAVGGPMREVTSVNAARDGGLEGDVPTEPDRGITLLSAAQWEQVARALGTALPWHTRRANVLVAAPSLGHLIGRQIRIGALLVDVKGETRPCGLMDRLHAGLRAALQPDCRAGVTGRIVQGGVLNVGDVVQLVE